MTTNRICKVAEYNNSVFLKAHCSCIDDDHVHTLILGYDTELNLLNLEIYAKSFTPWGNYDNAKTPLEKIEKIFKDWKRRISWIFSIIFKGYVETETSFEFYGEDQINDYLNALQEAKLKIKLFNDRKRRKKALISSGIINEDGDQTLINVSQDDQGGC